MKTIADKLDEMKATEEAEKKAEEEAVEEAPAKIENEEPLDRAERLNKEKEVLLKREEELIKRKEKMFAEVMVGGKANAGAVPTKPAKMTDTEYAEALERGEVNPLKEDGLI